MSSPVANRVQVWDLIDEASALRILNTFAVELIRIPGKHDLFWYIAQNVVGRLKFIDCVIYEADDAQTCLMQVAAWGEKSPFGRSILNPLVIPFGRGITGRVALTGQPMIVDDLSEDDSYIPDTSPARSEICVPLLLNGQVVGVIDCEHPGPKAFGAAELEILSTVAAMAAAKLELLAEAQRSQSNYLHLMASHAELSKEVSMRKALETKLFEARKLEAIGKLTGRIAHEFNNLLTVISGNLELLEVDGDSENAIGYLTDARTAAERGARLMHDMLVFAQRSRLKPDILDLNHLVSKFCKTRTTVDSATLETTLADDLWRVSVDPMAVETILLNLVQNAREATPSTGTVTILTENFLHSASNYLPLPEELPTGRYVRISVVDTGTGIPEDRLQQVFDPFYTTKPVGAGTGLGLSVVQGLAQQSGGMVIVASEAGKGSAFQVLLRAVS